MSSNSRYNTLVYKGTHHHSLKKEGWLYPWLGDVKFAKKQARRAQRRDNHKEIEAQLADAGRINTRWTVNEPEWYAVEKGIGSVFSPIPIFAMTEWERCGLEWYRYRPNLGKVKFRICWDGHNYPPIQDIPRWCNGSPKINTDDTLFETLQRSVNRS